MDNQRPKSRRADIFIVVEEAKKKWPITKETRVTILQPRHPFEPKPPKDIPGVETRELEAEWISHGWAGSYLEERDELIIGQIRKREKWEMVEGEPDWTWERW